MDNKEIILKMIEMDRLPQKPKRKYNLRDSNEYRYISRRTRYIILNRQHWYCNICGCKLKYSSNNNYPGKVAHIDHIFPWCKREEYNGDINELPNLQALCPECNMKKHSKNGY